MTYTTLQYNGVEKSLADWGVSACQREVSNQAHDHVACEIQLPADAADPIPYGGQIILRLGRVPLSVTPTLPNGLPRSGLTSWTGGATFFVGWRVENFRTGSPALENMNLKFAGPWEYFFERLVFQKLWFTWNGAANVADWRSQVVLGQSVNALVGPNDTVPGTNATNLMSIRQQVVEIINYCLNQTTADYGSPQFQSDALDADENGNYLLNPTYPGAALTAYAGAKILIPDFLAGYQVSDQSSASQAQSGTTPANMNTVLRAPLDSVNDLTCAEALRRQLKWIGPMGDAVVWFDYTQTPPALNISTRDQLPSISIPFIGQNAGMKIKRRDDLIPTAVALKFRVSGTWNNAAYVQVINDLAGAIGGVVYEGIGQTGALYTVASFAGGSPAYLGGSANSATMQALEALGRDFGNVTTTINFEGNSNTLARCLIGTMPVNIDDPSSDSSALPFWQKLFPEFKSLASPPSLFPGSSVSVTVDNPNNQNTTQPDDGTTVNLSTYQYLLTDGQVAPWMLAGNTSSGSGVQVVQAVINVKFASLPTTIVGSNTASLSKKDYVEKTARVTLVSIPGGLYQVQSSFVAGEIVPYGLAGYIYAIAQIPQYEGSFTIQEQEVTDQCPIGHNFNLSGGRAEWAAMNALVHSISYDLMTGKTTLSFGPAGHLGAKDLVERLRTNRYPIRPYYGNGGNLTNTANSESGAQLGNSVAQRGPSPGVENDVFHVFPVSTADSVNYSAGYLTAGTGTGSPGVTIDNRSSGQPGYGGVGAPNTPGVFCATGSAGTLGSCIRLMLGAQDIGSGGNITVMLREVPECDLIDGTPTNGFRLYLCSPFYTSTRF
jgi:hypothetical protein